MQARTITPSITISDQPSEADLGALKEQGYLGVVNLRNDGEPEQPIGTQAEGERVKALGLNYLHVGIGGGGLLDEHAANKVLVHCRKGGRAAALVLLHQAKHLGWKPDEAMDKGKSMGLEVEGGLRKMVEQYLRDHPPR
jgi:uncharacterized protein (TIGR01244 family)